MEQRDSAEIKRLDDIARWFDLRQGIQGRTTYWCALHSASMFRGDSCLELGCADGTMTRFLENYFENLVAVDGAAEFVELTRKRVSHKTRVIQSLFEELELDEQFHTILMAHVLEHVQDPVELLERVSQNWLAPDGILLIWVPNAWSLHRKAAVYMGLMSRSDELNELDRRLGHRRVYSPETLRQDIQAVGLQIEQTGGIFLKPLSNAQMEANWTEEMVQAYYALGFEFPDYCAEIYAKCSRRRSV